MIHKSSTKNILSKRRRKEKKKKRKKEKKKNQKSIKNNHDERSMIQTTIHIDFYIIYSCSVFPCIMYQGNKI